MVELWVTSKDIIGLWNVDQYVDEIVKAQGIVKPTFLTTGNTQGFALSSLYAPIPRSTFLSKVSALYAAIRPNRGSSGAFGTTLAEKQLMAGFN